MGKLSFYEKIQAVSNEIRNIEKNITVGRGDSAYRAVSDKDVIHAVREAETMYRLLSIPYKQELIRSEIVKTINSKGYESLYYMDIIKMSVKIVDLDSEASIEIETFGRGLDNGDKGFGKASTYARKYAILNAYKIATGEDPDSEKSESKQAVKEDQKRDAVVSYMLKDSEYTGKVLMHFNAGSIDDLTNKQVDFVYANLAKKNLL